ncbi:MAG: efflux RND transporter permease subunit [Neomegalonema sp.]|nr:efflux RND transporter permease subunit [Neomegalonema sp.]
MALLLLRERRVLALVLLMIAALGAATATTIGRQEDPTITNIFALAITPYPGADPARVEALVTEKIEAELRQIPDIKNITSTSRTGISVVQVELSEFTPKARIEQIWSEMRDALADAAKKFPAGVPEPEFDGDRVGAFTAIFALTPAKGADTGLGVLTRRAELLADQLRRLPGTDFVRVYGGVTEEILIEIEADKLATLGLTPDLVAAAISAADSKVRAGRVRGSKTDYLIEVEGEIDGVERVRRIPLVSSTTAPGAPVVHVGDVAKVRRTTKKPAEEIAVSKGGRAVLVAARMEPDLQVDTWMKRVKTAFGAHTATGPKSVDVELIFDQSEYTFARLSDLGANLALGVAIVVAVLLITLGWRSAVIVALALPLTAMVSLFVLEKIGIVIHQMSVTGMIVALGLLVDAAIVMTDDIRRSLSEGRLREDAVRIAVRRLTAPLLASTLTTMLTFVPMAAMPGPAGDFIGSIAFSVITMLGCSFLIAITITPALAGMMLRRNAPDAPRPKLGLGPRLFRWSLRRALANRAVAAAIAATPAVLGFLAFPTLTAQFFPGVDRDQFYVQIEAPPGGSIEATLARVKKADALLRGSDGIKRVDWVVGRNAPAFYYNMTADTESKPEFAEALIFTTSPEATARLIPVLQKQLDRALPGVQTLVRGLVQGPPVAAPLELRIVGPDLKVLRELGDKARRIMRSLPMVEHTRSNLSGGAPKLLFTFDEDKLRLVGLSLSDAARQLETLLEGAVGGSLIEGSEELPVRVRVAAADRASADRILALRLIPPSARSTASAAMPGVPLSALGKFELKPAQSPITRRNGERVNTVQGYLQLGVLPEEALKAFRAELAKTPMALPQGFRLEWGGDSDARGEVVTNLMATVGIVTVLMLASIVLTFNSWRLSLIALIVSGLSMGLSLLALAVFQYPFGIQALIGVIGSIGVSINAAIIIMTTLKEDPAARRNDREAIVRVVMRASRHIVSTTVTTFGGFLPLILAGGFFWPPFAMSIAGGVLLSTIVSLYFTPPLFSLLAGRKGYEASAAEKREAAAQMNDAVATA